MDSKPMSFCFVLTDAVLDDASPLELIPGYVLEKANSDQIEKIRGFLIQRFDFSELSPPYEWNITPGASEGQLKASLMERKDWRYLVINFEGANRDVEHLGWALHLCEEELEIGPSYVVVPPFGGGWVQQRAFITSFYNQFVPYIELPKSIRTRSLSNCRQYFDQIETLVPNHPNIRRAIREFAYLRALPRSSRFVIMGYFMVLECLITHAPKPSDSGDSLTRQIKSKMTLLERRFCRPLNWSVFSGNIPHETLWGKLYTYRSRIAHGAEIDFTDNELSCLKSDAIISQFMREVVKLVIIRCLAEPILMQDLQRC